MKKDDLLEYKNINNQKIQWDIFDIPECPNKLKNISKRQMKKSIKKILKIHIKYLTE